MTVYSKAASFFAAVCGIAAMLGTSTPGFAFDLDKTVNVAGAVPVPPAVVLPQIAEVPAVPADVPSTDTPVTVDDAIAYESLAAAVAAQDMPAAVEPDLTCMAGAIYFEAKGEPLSGQLAVAEVILNRAKSGRFPKSVCSVITQRGQFSFVRGGRIPAVGANHMYRTAMAVAQVAMADKWDSPASNALYFHARRVSPGWRMTKVAAIGNHIFYR